MKKIIFALMFAAGCVGNSQAYQENTETTSVRFENDCGSDMKTGVIEATLGTNCSGVSMDEQDLEYGLSYFTAAEQSLSLCKSEIAWHWSQANVIANRAYQLVLQRNATEDELKVVFEKDGYSYSGCTRPGAFMNTVLRIQRETKNSQYVDKIRSCRQQNETERFACLADFAKSVNEAMFSTSNNCGQHQCVNPFGSVSVYDAMADGLGLEFMDTKAVPAYCLISGYDVCTDGYMKEMLIGRYVVLRKIREEALSSFVLSTSPDHRDISNAFYGIVREGVERAGKSMTYSHYLMYSDMFAQDYPYRLWTSDDIMAFETTRGTSNYFVYTSPKYKKIIIK